ncbi:dihydroorotate dehydrogenase electron transfer subunit [Bacillus sp. D386]|uniref:dihydroorotate dehydrogenase electron transfer subunit n=1 Tax=Bacillus sp. D386 TaxID=2587155 RepID=UPI001121AB2F|nr:dihydroorotate dehydrogenase electron transfer subunit [Bacillus sp. D386]
MIQKEMMTVVSHRMIAPNIFEMTMEGTLVSSMAMPGQFVHIKVSNGIDPLLRRPISICKIDPEQSRFTIVYRAEGKGTRILSEKKTGEKVDVLGPLGNGFTVEDVNPGGKALLIGGGIGIPPLLQLSRDLTAKGVSVIHILGLRTAADIFYENEFAELGETIITTEDGTYGIKGYVTNASVPMDIDVVYTCGPTPMLKAVKDKYKGKKVFISLEERMGCGIGACFACVCRTPGNGYRKICIDGPVFRSEEVVI